ncbi:MAG: hypothetical protein AB7V46_15840 [Thermomicrobiales bacterium]
MKPMSAINNLKNLTQIMKELSLDDLQQGAEKPPRVLVLAASLEAADVLAETLTGEARSPYVTALRLDTPVDRLDTYDAAIVFDPDARPETRKLIEDLGKRNTNALIITWMSTDPTEHLAARVVRDRMLKHSSERAVSFGRHMPAFVAPAVKEVIDDTAAANAQFALIANVPSVIPILGTLATVSADFLVLTKNQLLLTYKVAAIHGRDLNNRAAILREMTPVAGVGFFWRTIAREAATLLPLAAGTVPKVAIAYSGTVAIGKAADYYYRFGEKPSKDLMKSYFRTGMESLKRRQFLFRDPKTVDAEFTVVEDRIEEPDKESFAA